MTSKFVFCTLMAAFAAVGTAMAEEEDSSAVASYYEKNLKDSPQGVYEWAEKGILFVQVRVEHHDADSDDVGALVLLAEQRELHEWLARFAVSRKKETELPVGLDRLRTLIRKNYPLFEFSAGWKYSFEGRQFSREEGAVRVACAVCRRADVEASMPAAYLEEPPRKLWLDGACQLVSDSYLGRTNAAFMATVGLLDCAQIYSTSDFDALELVKDSSAYGEFSVISAGLAQYLESAPLPKRLRADRERIRSVPTRLDCAYEVPVDETTTNSTVSVKTNLCVVANVTTNIAEVSAKGVSDHNPLGGTFMARRITQDESIITTVETVSIVRTRKLIRQKVLTDYFGEARFEDLFLSGGSKANVPGKRTDAGMLAEKSFYAPDTVENHERAVIEALRENPGDKVLWNLCGRLLQEKKDWVGSLVCFRNALRLDHEYQYALVNLAVTYAALDKRELSAAAAAVAYGVSTDGWCRNKAESILTR